MSDLHHYRNPGYSKCLRTEEKSAVNLRDNHGATNKRQFRREAARAEVVARVGMTTSGAARNVSSIMNEGIGEAARNIGDLAAGISENIICLNQECNDECREQAPRAVGARANNNGNNNHNNSTVRYAGIKVGRVAIGISIRLDRQLPKKSQRLNDTTTKHVAQEAKRQDKMRSKQLRGIIKQVHRILKKAIKAYGLTQDELAGLTQHISYQVLSAITDLTLRNKLQNKTLSAQAKAKVLRDVRLQVSEVVCKTLQMRLIWPGAGYDQFELNARGTKDVQYSDDAGVSYYQKDPDQENDDTKYDSDSDDNCSSQSRSSADEHDDNGSRSEYSKSSEYTDSYDDPSNFDCSDASGSTLSDYSDDCSESWHSTHKDSVCGSSAAVEETSSDGHGQQLRKINCLSQHELSDQDSVADFHDCLEEFIEFVDTGAATPPNEKNEWFSKAKDAVSTTSPNKSKMNGNRKKGMRSKQERAMAKIIDRLQSTIKDLQLEQSEWPGEKQETESEIVERIVERLTLPLVAQDELE